MRSLNHSRFELYYHVIFVTKYRHNCISSTMLSRLDGIFRDTLQKWKCSMIEFNGESDHVHLLIEAHPSLDLSVLVNNLKTVSSRLIRKEFKEDLASYYWKPYFWSGGYAVKTATSGASIEKLIEYIRNQEKPEPERR